MDFVDLLIFFYLYFIFLKFDLFVKHRKINNFVDANQKLNKIIKNTKKRFVN